MSFENELSTANKELAIQTLKKDALGEPVPREGFPTAIWAKEENVTAPPHLVSVNGFWVVSGKAAAVLKQFDLGRGALYPVDVFQSDRKTAIPGQYHCWNMGNTKTALVADASIELRPFGVARVTWNLPWVLRDDTIAVSKAALEGPDVWLDTLLFKSLFFSGTLGTALEAAGLHKAFRLRRARVVGQYETGTS